MIPQLISTVRKTRWGEAGFSLLEISVTLTIIGILAAIASVSILKQSPSYRLRQTTWAIQARLNLARYKAVLEETPFRCVFDERKLNLEKYDPDSGNWKLYQTSLFEGVTVSANNSPVFHPQGTVSNLASILVSNQAGSFKITLAISGRIKVVPQ